MTIRTFEELSDAEVVALTEEQFKHYCAIEMMAKGVVIPKAPLEVTEKPPKLATKTYFRPKQGYHTVDFAFATAAEAAEFMSLRPVKVEYDYNAGYSTYYAKEGIELSIEAVELCSQAAYEGSLADMIRINSANTQYQKDKAEYDKQSKAAADAVQWMVERRGTCVRFAQHLEQIRQTNIEYIALCEGNERAARNFLSKRFTARDIEEALGKEQTEVVYCRPES